MLAQNRKDCDGGHRVLDCRGYLLNRAGVSSDRGSAIEGSRAGAEWFGLQRIIEGDARAASKVVRLRRTNLR
jgi:hypothetical protein